MQKTDSRIETWNGRPIRFVQNDGEWWAVAKDVADALGYANTKESVNEHCKGVAKCYLLTAGGKQQVSIISEKDIYRLIFRSRLPEAEAFQDWMFDIIKKIREEALGLKSYEAFRLMDKEHQKAAMSKLFESLREPVKIDYIKANTIANKAVSTMHGCPVLIKKGAMNEAMLREREAVLADTVDLMAVNERFGLGLSVSGRIYRKYGG
jgi:prophage antirepressor-like protein